MKIVEHINLADFDFWAGAVNTAKYLTKEDFEEIECFLEESVPENNLLTSTEVNDFFWFEEDTIAEWLGYDSFEDIMNEQDGKEE